MKHLKKIILYGFDFLYLLKKNLEKAILKESSFCLRVLIYHDVKSKSQIELFKNQILSLKKEYDFISPNEFGIPASLVSVPLNATTLYIFF